ncbi:hypothetical protein GH714_012406 [Hevea brasiliensis]|uniref:DNA-directed RNA polymerase III subunit RPC9 n=1 Tax=Hevea brasiliensis TaxID=3981 RepID=A0A6A6KSG1_HEVBR|nr:hypothetical protein GH714_012406 [Hevea brasiliensis]
MPIPNLTHPSDHLGNNAEKTQAGALTNFEVLDFLKARGASKDSSRVIAPVASSEYKANEETIYEFMKKCKTYKLAKAEILNIINIAPRELVEIDRIALILVFALFLFASVLTTTVDEFGMKGSRDVASIHGKWWFIGAFFHNLAVKIKILGSAEMATAMW